jgi:hypothetical protein
MTGLLKALQPIIAVITALILVSCAEPAHGSIVSGDVSGDWTMLMNPVTAIGDCHIPAGDTLRIRGGVQVRLAPGASITVDGTLTATGSDTFPVLISPADADTGAWGSLVISPTGQANLSNCTIRGGGAAEPGIVTGMIRVLGPGTESTQLILTKCDINGSSSSGVFIDQGSMTTSRSRFWSNGGVQPTDAAIHVVTGTATFGVGPDANEIDNGVFGVYNADVVPINASGQWWGAGSGPQTPDNVPGQGSSVSDDVLFDNWITVAPHPLSGDVDRDGAVTVNDVALLLRVCSGVSAVDLTTVKLGDVVPNQVIDLLDAARLSRVVAGFDMLP